MEIFVISSTDELSWAPRGEGEVAPPLLAALVSPFSRWPSSPLERLIRRQLAIEPEESGN